MKKLLLLMFLWIGVQAYAQEVRLIPRIGLNIASITNDEADEVSVRPGVNTGFGFDVMWNEKIGVETGVYYSMQGNKSKGGGVSYTTKLDYINIPVYFKGNVYKGLYLFAGPQFGFNFIQKNHSSSVEVPSLTIDMNVIRKFDFALGIGAGYQFDCGFLVSANYNFGLTDAWKSFEWGNQKKMSNRVFQLNLGYAFKL